MRHEFFAMLCIPLFLSGCSDTCENVDSQTVLSPSASHKAIAFSRNCGATTGFNTQVTVLRANDQLPNEAGNAFVANGTVPIVLHWNSDTTLQVSGVGDAPSIKQLPVIAGVAVTYAK